MVHTKMTKSACMLGLASSLSFFSLTHTAQAVDRTVFVHLFEWKWNDIAQECEDFLGPKGFNAVQVSPPQGHIDGDAWWTRYQPTNYNFESRSGSRTEFQSMVQRCKAAGVQIYVDAMINHMAAWDRSFPEVPYSYDDFHSCTSDIDYSDRWQVQNCYTHLMNNCIVVEQKLINQRCWAKLASEPIKGLTKVVAWLSQWGLCQPLFFA